MTAPEPSKDAHTLNAAFHTTRWSVVLGAQGKASRDAFESLEALCGQYWLPLYAYVRRRGFTPPEAEDLTQEFFARLLEKEWLAAARRECGRFRSFLLMALQRFLANEWDRSQALKRGGRCEVISLDAGIAESLYATNPATLPRRQIETIILPPLGATMDDCCRIAEMLPAPSGETAHHRHSVHREPVGAVGVRGLHGEPETGWRRRAHFLFLPQPDEVRSRHAASISSLHHQRPPGRYSLWQALIFLSRPG